MKRIFLFIAIIVTASSVYSQADSTLKEYTGRFVFPEGSIIADATVVLEGDQLSMVTSVGTSALTKAGIDSFTIVEYSGLAVFKRSDAKVINGVHIDAAGYIMDGVKEEAKGISFIPYLKPDYVFNNRRLLKF